MAEPSYPEPPTDGAVRLRSWRDDDVPCVEQASRDPRIPEATTVPARYTAAEALAFIRRQHGRLATGEGISFAIAAHSTDEALGLVILSRRPQAGVAGIGYWVVPKARRRGLATRAVGIASGWGLDAGGFARVEAWVEPDNRASQRVLEANGFAREGLLRSFLVLGARRADVLVYSRI
ncbi:GNAT family N-acetyltransferase [Murinocardiopsis flavida]|nr:GNAT family protein [Murinocardiopsis flavida]